MADTIIWVRIAYGFYAFTYFFPVIKKVDKKIIALQKTIYILPKCTPNAVVQLPYNSYETKAFLFERYVFKMY